MPNKNSGVDDLLNQHQDQITSPAAPAGLQQEAASRQADSVEGLLAGHEAEGYVPSSQQWYTGANTEGTDNGWDSTFGQQFVEGANKALEEGTLDSYFESKEKGKGTGIVLYNFTSDQGTEMKLGDIYQDGKKTGNVYDQFDEDTANLMLADWMLDGDEKADAFSKSDPMSALKTAISDRAAEDSAGWLTAKDLEVLNAESQVNAETFQEGVGDEAAAGLAGVATGAMAVGGVAAATGVGIVPGAIIFGAGALLGGAAAYLNRDAISQQAGRAYTITSMSREEFGLPSAIGTGIEQWSGVAGKSITPFGNLVEGSFDAAYGETGDTQSEFFRVDRSTGGESQVNGWWKTAHLAAAVGDAGLQFASPIGVQLYTAQMSSMIGGSVFGLAASGGNTFDFETGKFDNIFTDESGGFDPLSASAGIGKIGIDALQVGFARGLAGKVDSSLKNVGEEAVYGSTKGFNFLRPFRTAEQRTILKEGGTSEIIAGREFFKNAAGDVVSQRRTIQLLAPSESVMFMNTRVRAIREAKLRGGQGVDVEDYYAAARSLSQGERKVNAVLLNAFGEGYEEGVQGILEPWSHDHAVNWKSLAEQFAYGAAMGGGMGASAAFNSATQAQKNYSLAKAGWELAGRGDLSKETWDSMSQMEQGQVIAMGNLKNQQIKAAHEQLVKDNTATEMATVVGRDKMLDAARKKAATEAKRSVPGNPDQAITIVALDDASFRADAVTSSSVQLGRSIDNRLAGYNMQLQTLENDLADAKARLETGEGEDVATEVATVEAQIRQVHDILRFGLEVRKLIEAHVERVQTMTEMSAIEAEAEIINDILRKAFDQQYDSFAGRENLTPAEKMALAKAVSMVKTRDPQDANRSWQVLVPQVDYMLTAYNSDGVVGISQTILPAIRGDYDGDKVRDQNQLMLDDSVYATLRAGQQFYGAGDTTSVAATKSEKDNQRKLWTALSMGSKAGLNMEAMKKIMEIGVILRDRYDGVVDPAELEEALGKFLRAVRSGPDKDARQILVSAILAMPSAGALTQWSREQLSNEPAFIGRLVNLKLQEFQQIYARHTPRSGDMHPTGADVELAKVIPAENQVVAFELRDDLGFASNERGIIALGREGQIAGQATFNETDTALTYHLASVDPAFQGQGLSAAIRILFEDYALRRGLRAVFPDVINPEMAKGYRARPDKYREITQDGDPYPSFESTTVAGTEDAAKLQAEATRIRDAARKGSAADPTADLEEMATDVRGRAILPGNTEGAALSAQLPADSIMRLFQQLHYAVNRSNDIDAQDWSNSPMLAQWAEIYAALTSMLTRDVLAEIRGKDEVNTRVYAMLQILGRELQNHTGIDTAKAAALIANVRVADFELNENGEVVPGPGKGNITLSQLLLKLELNAWKDRNSLAWDLDPDLQAKYDRLIPLTRPPTQRVEGSTKANAERAFAEVMGAQSLYELLGEAAEGIGSNLTVEQYIRMLADLTPKQHAAHAAQLRLDKNYSNTGEAKTTTITPPYSIEDLANNDIEHATAFRSVIDSIISASNSRRKERESDSGRTSKKLWAAHTEIRRILQEYAKEQKVKISRKSLKAMLVNNPVLTRRIYDLIPDSATNLAFPLNANGEVMVSPWVYDMLMESDPQHAEMIYFRNLLMLQWDEARVAALGEGSYADEAKLEFGKLKRRLHRVMWNLRNSHDGGILYAQFLVELEKPNQTVEKFIDWVNENPALAEGAPIVAWYDDVSDFDMDKAGGGWSDDMGMSELRTAISALATTAKGISIVDDIALDERDQDLVDAIGRVVDPGRVATPADQQKYDQLEQRLKEAGKRTMALGPAAIFYQVFAAAKGFYGIAHMKGKNPQHLEAIAAHDALSGQFGYLTEVGRVTAAVTAHTLDAVDGNVSLTIDNAGRAIDPETGNIVEWDAFTPEVWLEMMSTPDSRKLARAIVSTQVMERDDDGVMRVKTMHGSSLQDLLDGTSYRDLFEKSEGVSQLDMDLRYLSTLDAEAGRFGGHFAVQRALNDFVIARITAAESTLTDAGIESLVVKAMQDFARTVRVTGSLPANLDGDMNTLDSNDPMEAVHDDFVKALRAKYQGRRLDMGAGADLDAAMIERYVAEREKELDDVLEALLAEKENDNTEAGALEIQARIDAHHRDTQRFRDLYQNLKDENFVKTLIMDHAIPDEATDPEGNAAAKQRLIDFVLSHEIIRTKVPEVSNIANRILANARADSYGGFMENISPEEWVALANGVVAMRFDAEFTTSAPSATITPIPNPDSKLADRIRFYDPVFSYLATPFLDPRSPILRAARSMHRQSGRLQQVVGTQDVIDAVSNNIFREGSLGNWNSDVPKFSIEANAGIDSASGIPAISIFGTLHARDKTIAAAKERSFDVPPDELLSIVELDWILLNDKTLTNPVTVTHPTGAVQRPLAQLLNRFAKTVTATYVDAQGNEVAVDLLAFKHHVGRPFGADPTAAASGLVEVHTDRILKAVQRLAHQQGVPPESIKVSMAFFHPDMKPAQPGWYNNLYFEGTSFSFDADTARSLPETLNFFEGAANPVGQNLALDSRKKGVVGFFKAKLPSFKQVKSIEENFLVDLSRVIREKTQLILDTEMGGGHLDAEYYNAIYSSMLLRHYVEHVWNGEKVRWTAEQVIAHQLSGGDPLQNAELWIPPDDVLRSMLGGAGPYAVPDIETEADLGNIEPWNGDMTRINARFTLDHKTVGLDETDLVNRQAQRQLRPRARLSEVERQKHDLRVAYRQELVRTGRADRAQLPARERGYDPVKNLQRTLAAAGGAVEAEDIHISLQNAGAAFFPPRDRGKLDDSLRVLQEVMGKLPTNTSGFVYQHSWPDAQVQADDITGIITQVSIEGHMPKGMQPLPGDVIAINTASFRGDYELATKTIDHFIKAGLIVVLGEGTGRTNMRAELGNYLESQQYKRVGGSVHVFAPLDGTARYRVEAAKRSTLTSWGAVSAQSRLGVLQVSDQNVEENTAWVDPADPKLATIAETINVFQGDVYGGFNVPAPDQVESVITALRALDTKEGRDFLLRQTTGHIKSKGARRRAGERFLMAWAELMDRFEENQNTVLPGRGREFGTGFIIPLVDQQGQIILARHGHKAPPASEIKGFLRAPLTEGSLDAVRVAVYSGVRDENATSHTGRILSWSPISKFGLRVRMTVDTQTLGNKLLFQWNGFKALLAPRPSHIKLPQRNGVAMPMLQGLGINAIVSRHDITSKQSVGDTMTNHQTAFWIFGVDFLPDVAASLGVSQEVARDILLAVADMPKISVEDAHYLNTGGGLTLELLNSLSTMFSGLETPVSAARLNNPESYQDQITRGMIVYLMTQGSSVSAVLRSGSVARTNADPNARAVRMPELFTQIFDLAPLNSELRIEMNKRFQAKMPLSPDGTGYVLHPDFMLEVRNSDDSGEWLQGYLQVPEVHASGDNPVFNDMSYDPEQKSKYSTAAESMVEQSLAGTRLAQVNKLTAFNDFVNGKAVRERQAALAEDGGVWRMLTGIQRDDGRSAVWRVWQPLEATYLTNGADAAMIQFRQELEKADWTEDEIKSYENKALQVINRLGLKRSQIVLVDYWVRQMGGRWKDVLEPGPQNELSGAAANEYVGYVLKNVEDGYFPTLGAEVPATHLADAQLIFRANRETHVWQPRESIDRAKARKADFNDWNAWAEIAIGSILTADHLFSPMYLTALDGFLHTWEHALPGLSDLPVSLDVIRAAGLMDPDNNRMLVSLSPHRNTRLQNAPILGADARSLEDILGGRMITGRFQHEKIPNAEIAKHRANRRKWAKENDVPLVVDVSLKDLKSNGIRLMSEGSNTSSLMRMLVNLRVGTALLNPMLYVSMGPEQWARGSLDRVANLLTGQSTVGMGAKLAARAGASTFTSEQIKQLDTIYAQMGKDTQFKFSVWEALDFLNPVQHGQARVSRYLEKYARMGALMQDPTRGMSAKTLARRYVEAALQAIAADPMKYGMTKDMLIDRLTTDPTYIEKNMPEVHIMASNALAQIRSLKSTPLSLMIRGIYEPFSDSHHSGANFFGTLLLKLPLIFSTYAMNVATTLTGMQGFSDFAAAASDGRSKKFVARMQSAIKGEKVEETIDMSEVMEGVDLARSFIRGGITHTGLFVMGMIASELGLSGEDDETKKRRKLAALSGVHPVLDPTALENDFRNKDVIFLDWLPMGLDQLFLSDPSDPDSRSVAQLPWLLRQFVSPIIGMEKFFETGDFSNVRRGYADALGAFPLINTSMWADVVETTNILQNMAKEQEEFGREENMSNAMWFLTNSVGLYEKMLFENSFVNEFYVAMDRYDRNPYVLPLRDSDGELQKDIEGNVRPNDIALEQYIDPETGEVKEGYQNRNDSSATLHALTENRATLAFLTSIFTGGPADSDFNRYNMPVKTRSMDADVATQDEAEAIIRAAMEGAARQGMVLQDVSYEEILGKLKSDYASTGNWDAYNNVEVEAKRIYKQQNGAPAALSILDDDGREVLTEDGAIAVLTGLSKGLVNLGDESLAGIHITFETREAIQKQWMADLKQEGIDMGLDDAAAVKRVNRLWYGPTEDPTIPGIKDYLWSDQISYDKTLTYAQLNTTYVQGPDGKPWATGFSRRNLFNMTGILPLNRAFISEKGAMGVDERMNSTDMVNGLNLGLRSLELVDKTSYIPTDAEIGESIVKAIEALGNSTATPFTPYKTNSSGGGGYGGGSYGGGGSPFYPKMYAPSGGTTTYVDPLPTINTSNPYIRRASIRRERVWSEKGRLKQWQ